MATMNTPTAPTPKSEAHEVEIRGLLTKEQYDTVKAQLSVAANKVEHDDRKTTFFIMDGKTLKVTKREDGSMAKVALKLGDIKTSISQKEIEIPIDTKHFDNYVDLFMGLGFTEIQVTQQMRTNFLLQDGTEISMKWSKDLGYHFEADKVVPSESAVQTVRQELIDTVARYGMKPMTEQEFTELCNRVEAEYRSGQRK